MKNEQIRSKVLHQNCEKEKTAGPIFLPMNPFQYYEMSYGLNVEMHKQVIHPHKKNYSQMK